MLVWFWSLSVLLVLHGSFHRSQPRFTAFDPQLIARCEGSWGFRQDPEFDFCFLIVSREQARATARAEVPPVELGCFTRVTKLTGWPYSVERKGGTALLPAVSAVADTYSKGFAAHGDLHLSA